MSVYCLSPEPALSTQQGPEVLLRKGRTEGAPLRKGRILSMFAGRLAF